MARMIKMEAVVFARYFKQLAFTMAFTMACVAIGMGTISAIPSIAFVMMMFSASVSGSAYDEQNDWGPTGWSSRCRDATWCWDATRSTCSRR